MTAVARTLAQVRLWSQQHPEAAVRVFGSVMRGNPQAHDVDMGVDLDTPPWLGEVSGPGDMGRLGAYTDLLECRRLLEVGSDGKAALDVFVRSGGKLFSPTEDGYWWKEAYDPTIWLKIQLRGILLSAVVWPPVSA